MFLHLLSPARIRLYCLYFVLFLIGCTFLMMFLGLLCPVGLVSPAVEEPVIAVREDAVLRTGITQIVSDDEHLYVLYGKYSLVEVYTPDGTYRYTISVYCHTNGRTEIAARDGNLYICDRIQNVYTFQGGQLTAFTEWTESLSLRQRLELGSSDPDYTVKGSSVWHIPGEQCVIERPGWLWIYQNDFLTVFLFVLFALVGHLTFMPTLRKSSTI